MFSKPLRELLSLEGEVDDVSLISIDSKGTDIRVRQGAEVGMESVKGIGTEFSSVHLLSKRLMEWNVHSNSVGIRDAYLCLCVVAV